MAKYQVLEGVHVDGAHVYRKGDVVSTHHDYLKMFPGKFAVVGNEVPATVGQVMSMNASKGVLAPPPEAGEPGDPQRPQTATTSKPAKAPKPAGKDVTVNFDKAVEQDFKVFKSGGQYFVYDADDMSKPCNDEGVNKDGVDAVIEANLA